MKEPATRIACICLVTVIISATAPAADQYWPTWRGPGRIGVSPAGNPPLTWSESENIKWKVELSGDASNSSPIIWKDRIFFQISVKADTAATPTPAPQDRRPMRPGERPGGRGPGGPMGGRGPGGPGGGRGGFGGGAPTDTYRFALVCLDRNTGKTIWEKAVREEVPHQGHHRDHGFASFSPVTDGNLLWAHFGSRGLHCFDLDGNPRWSKDLGRMNTVAGFGEGGSLALAGDAVVVVMDHEGDSAITALNKLTGDILWKKDRDEGTSWATPLPIEVDGKTQIVTSATNLIRSYDLETGDIIWQCSGQTRNVIPSPVVGSGVVYCTSGYRGSALQAIKLGRTGDLSGSDAVIWQVNEGTPYVPSPLLYQDRIYVCSGNNGVISCYNAKTGKPNFTGQNLEEIRGVYASPAAAANRVYFVGRNGVTCVLEASDEFKVLAVNKLDDAIDCSPAFVDDEMFLKGKKYLYCIAKH